MRQKISPHYGASKLNPPWLYRDLVDVYRDRVQYWLLEPAISLLKDEHGQVAAVALATTYIEGAEIYRSGEDSRGRSKQFFRRGFQRIFFPESAPQFYNDAIADAMYDYLRCGMAHEGAFRNQIFFGRVKDKPIYTTWPVKDGELDPAGHIESILINPPLYVAGIVGYFQKYIAELKESTKSEVAVNFKAAVDLKWDLGGPERAMAGLEEGERDGA